MNPYEASGIETRLTGYIRSMESKSEEDNIGKICALTLGLGGIFAWINYAVRLHQGKDYGTRREQASRLESLIGRHGGEGGYSDQLLEDVNLLCDELKSCYSKKLLAIAESFQEYLGHPRTKRYTL